MKITLSSLLLSLMLLAGHSAAATSLNRELQGYNWYSEVAEKEQQQKDKDPQESKLDGTKNGPELPEYERNIRQLKRKRKEAHRRAVDQPSFENILAELYYERMMSDKATLYSSRRVAVANMLPQLINMDAHNNVLHQRISNEQHSRADYQKLLSLSKEWGLILQVQDECAYCHVFAPIVKDFAQEHGFELLAASRDGQSFEGIEGVVDRGQMRIFNPRGLTPMLYLLKHDGSEVLPISRGINNAVKITENIMSIDKHIRRLF